MRKILLVFGVVGVLALAGWVVRWATTIQARASHAQISAVLTNLFDGLQIYKDNVGSYPAGGNADVARALDGRNPKRVVIGVGRKVEQNSKGEFIDPWGTPFRFYFSDNSVLIWSAGPNRRFEKSNASDFDDFIQSN